MIICNCKAINDKEIRRMTEQFIEPITVEDITQMTGAGGLCGVCLNAIQECLDDIYKE